MEYMIRKLDYYRPSSENTRHTEKKKHFLMQKNFTKEKKMILIEFENGIFPLPQQYLSGSG